MRKDEQDKNNFQTIFIKFHVGNLGSDRSSVECTFVLIEMEQIE